MRKLGTAVALVACCLSQSACKVREKSLGNIQTTDGKLIGDLPSVAILTQDFFAKNAIGISSDIFRERWKNSLASPLIFFRSHVRAFYDITKNLELPSSIKGSCFGDAHVANFGFVEGKDSLWRFLYNDLNDSGICPVALDALRYFTSLRFLEQKELVSKEIDFYKSVITGKEKSVQLSKRFQPDLEKTRSKVVAKSSKDGRLIREPGVLDDASPALASQISSFVEEVLYKEQQNGKVLDVALASGRGGGSFGLTRYWALVGMGNEDIVEVKESVEPATSLGRWGQVPGARLDTLKNTFWGGNIAARIYRDGQLFLKTFVVRSRVKVSVDPEKFDSSDKEEIYRAQVSLMADMHRVTFGMMDNVAAKSLADWLELTSQELADLYKDAFKKAR